MLGIADALTGNFAAARERLGGALRSYGFDRDAQTGYRPSFAAAVTETLAGDPERAVDHLEALLDNPSPISVGLLEAMPIFDALRDESTFQELLERYRGPRQPS
jgi:hypothetical protein